MTVQFESADSFHTTTATLAVAGKLYQLVTDKAIVVRVPAPYQDNSHYRFMCLTSGSICDPNAQAVPLVPGDRVTLVQ